ncbi:putative tetratricopeptide-like helical domain-containing protein [Lupinus albus]|uniref:Putative tetratricopeptide-like helical domain-containing protein n=1 Tax=Lupinus albus TaxID=3870 RepID=A0A6A4QN81_LUPAL|nr:putative tetratricopeptide-like helical domain-containing protein [Lupinus albus]
MLANSKILLRRRRRRSHLSSPSTTLRRHFSTVSSDYTESAINEVIKLLQQSNKNNSNSDKLNTLLFKTLSSHNHFLQISLRLGSSSKAINFLEYLSHNAPTTHHFSLSSVFQGAIQLSTQQQRPSLYSVYHGQPNSENKLLVLYKYRKSKNWTFPLTPKSALLLFQCFEKAQMVNDLVVLLKELHPSAKSTCLCNGLLRVLLKSGRVQDARNVLDEMLEPGNMKFAPDGFTGEIVFGELVNGRSVAADEEIVRLVTLLGEGGVFPDTFRLTQLITKLCRRWKNGIAWEVLHCVMKLGGGVEAASCNAMLTGLGKERDIGRMNELLAEMEEMKISPNVITFGILVNHLCKARRIDEALQVFDRLRGKGESNIVGVEPDVVLYNTLIDGLCKVGREEEGLRLLEEMKTVSKHRPNTITYNCLIDGLCKAGNVDNARALYNQMIADGLQPSVVTLNTLIDGFCKHGMVFSAVEFFNEMKGKGLKGNTATYTVLISAFCGVNNIDKAMEYYDEMLCSGCSPDAIVYYTLISGLSIAGRMDDASVIVSKLKESGFCLDTACCNVLISGFCKKKKVERVYDMLNEMENTGIKPDTVTYNTLISYLGKAGDFTTADKVMKKMIKEGLQPSVVTYGAVINAYCLSNNVDEAMKRFKEMCSTSKIPPNTVIYNILIDALCKVNDVKRALSLMDDMKVRGVRPNTTTYNAILKGVRDEERLDEAFILMDRMIGDACNPDCITMEILTEWLSAVGEIEKLKRFIEGYQVLSCSESSAKLFVG